MAIVSTPTDFPHLPYEAVCEENVKPKDRSRQAAW